MEKHKTIYELAAPENLQASFEEDTVLGIETSAFIYKSGLEAIGNNWKKKYGDKHEYEKDIETICLTEDLALAKKLKENEKVRYHTKNDLGLDIWIHIPKEDWDKYKDGEFYETDFKTYFYETGEKLSILDGTLSNDESANGRVESLTESFHQLIFSKKEREEREKLLTELVDKMYANKKEKLLGEEKEKRQIRKEIRKRVWVYRISEMLDEKLNNINSKFFEENYFKAKPNLQSVPMIDVEQDRDINSDDITELELYIEASNYRLSKIKSRIKNAMDGTDREVLKTEMANYRNEQRELKKLEIAYKSQWHFKESWRDFKDKISEDGAKGMGKASIKAGLQTASVGIAKMLGKIIGGKDVSPKEFGKMLLQEVLPNVVGAALDFFTGGVGGKLVNAFCAGLFAKPAEDSELTKFIKNEFTEFRNEVKEQFSLVLAEINGVKENTDKILDKLDKLGPVFRQILLEADGQLFLQKSMDEVRSKIMSIFSEIINNQDDVLSASTNNYKVVLEFLANYKFMLAEVHQRAFKIVSDEEFKNVTAENLEQSVYMKKMLDFIADPQAREGSLIAQMMQRTGEADLNYFEVADYVQGLCDAINSYTVLVYRVAEKLAEYIGVCYHYPRHFDAHEAMAFQRAVVSNIKQYRKGNLGLYDFRIGKKDTTKFITNLTSPGFNTELLMVNTFGENFTMVYNSLNSETSLFEVEIGENQYLRSHLLPSGYASPVAFPQYGVELHQHVDKDTIVGLVEGNYNYKWRVLKNEEDGTISLQDLSKNEFKFLYAKADKNLAIEGLSQRKMPDKYKWEICFRAVKKEGTKGEGGIVMDLQHKSSSVKLEDVFFKKLSGTKDIRSREVYLNEINKEKYKVDGKITEESENEAFRAVTHFNIGEYKVSKNALSIACFDSIFYPVIYKEAKYISPQEIWYKDEFNKDIRRKVYFEIKEDEVIIYEYLKKIGSTQTARNKLSNFKICETKDFDLLRYEAVDDYGVTDVKYKKGGLFAYKRDESGLRVINGRKYKRVPSKILENISGDYSTGMVLTLTGDGMLKIMDRNGKMVWMSDESLPSQALSNIEFHWGREKFESKLFRKSKWVVEKAVETHLSRTGRKRGCKYIKGKSLRRAELMKGVYNYKDPKDGYKVDYCTAYISTGHISLERESGLPINRTDIEVGNPNDMPFAELRVAKSEKDFYNEVDAHNEAERSRWFKVDVNLNAEKSGSVPAYLFARLCELGVNYSDMILNIDLLVGDSNEAVDRKAREKQADGWILIDRDLNKGSGGKYLKLIYQKLKDV